VNQRGGTSDKATSKKPLYRRRWFVIPACAFGVLIILGIIGAVFPNKSTPPTTTTTTHAVSASTRFSAIDGKALPGLPSSNWPVFSAVSKTPELSGATAEQSTRANDRGVGFGSTRTSAFVVDIFNFPNAGAETKFFDNSDNVLANATPAGSGIVTIPGPTGFAGTGITGQSNQLELVKCGGSSSVEPDNKCSGSVSKPVVAGVITVFERGLTVTVITDSGLLAENAKVAQSVITLLASVGIN
jgi:hypothetical protein